jgi:ankyrin repeat protein
MEYLNNDNWNNLIFIPENNIPNPEDIKNNNIEKIKNLVNENINDIIFDNYNALMYACEINRIDLIELLLKKNVNINKKNNYGITALMIATRKGYT